MWERESSVPLSPSLWRCEKGPTPNSLQARVNLKPEKIDNDERQRRWSFYFLCIYLVFPFAVEGEAKDRNRTTISIFSFVVKNSFFVLSAQKKQIKNLFSTTSEGWQLITNTVNKRSCEDKSAARFYVILLTVFLSQLTMEQSFEVNPNREIIIKGDNFNFTPKNEHEIINIYFLNLLNGLEFSKCKDYRNSINQTFTLYFIFFLFYRGWRTPTMIY